MTARIRRHEPAARSGWLGRPLPAWIVRLDRRIERFVAEGPGRMLSWGLALFLAALLLACVWLQQCVTATYSIDVYILVVVAACFAFRERGLWVVPLCLACSVAPQEIGPGAPPLAPLLARHLLALFTWTFVGFFTSVTLARYVEIRRYKTVMQQDVALARTLQRALMPRHFESPCVRVDCQIEQTRDIGGDFCYLRPFKEKYVVVSLGDIMGKGTPAAMVMAIVMGFFYEWGKQSFSPAFILGQLNQRLASLWTGDDSWFCTMFYAIYDEESQELVYSSGGHQAALLVRAGDGRAVEQLRVEGLPIGIFKGLEWEEKRVRLEPGDRVVVFTDGVYEARSLATGEQFGVERLERALCDGAHLSPAELTEHVIKVVRQFTGEQHLDDDLAVLVMEVRARGAAAEVREG